MGRSSLRTRIGEPVVGLRELAGPYELDGLDEGARGVARLLLEGAVGIERDVACRIGFIVADITIDRGAVACAQEADVGKPVRERTPQCLRACRIAMHDHG